ncbi:MAG: hypothetical protein ACU0DW_07995 [Shimia sp.]
MMNMESGTIQNWALSAPFTPAQIAQALSWVPNGSNQWRGTVPGAEGTPVVVAFDWSVASPDRMDLRQSIDVSGLYPGCTIKTVARYDHAG